MSFDQGVQRVTFRLPKLVSNFPELFSQVGPNLLKGVLFVIDDMALDWLPHQGGDA